MVEEKHMECSVELEDIHGNKAEFKGVMAESTCEGLKMMNKYAVIVLDNEAVIMMSTADKEKTRKMLEAFRALLRMYICCMS